MTDKQRAHAESHAKVCADLGLTRADVALFIALHYGLTTTLELLPGRAAAEDYNPIGPVVTEEECRVAMIDCLAKGWLQVIDESTRARIAGELRAANYVGPVYACGGPELGCVDFTEAGLALWRRLGELTRPPIYPPHAYLDIVHEKTAWFFPTSAAAVSAIEESRRQKDVAAVTGPTPIGPWRAQWWRRFTEGYRIDIEERRRWQCCGSGGEEHCYLDHSARNSDPGRLQDVLDRHNVTLGEWLLLESMEWFRGSALHLCRQAESSTQLLGVAISEAECRDGLESCLRYDWLRVVDQPTIDDVRSLLAADSAYLALPRTAENRPRQCSFVIDPLRPGQLLPVPLPASHQLGEIDFSPAGAQLYRMICSDWLGPDWENNFSASRGYYWEEHHYCETDDGFERIVQEHIAKGDNLRAARVVPLGPWCVYWWERFPTGYRLELELENPDPEDQ